jgi:hypothetical protein
LFLVAGLGEHTAEDRGVAGPNPALPTFILREFMRTILVDAALTFTIEINGKFEIFSELLELLESFPNRKIIVTNANDEEMKKFGLVNAPYEVFSLKHNPNKTNTKIFK